MDRNEIMTRRKTSRRRDDELRKGVAEALATLGPNLLMASAAIHSRRPDRGRRGRAALRRMAKALRPYLDRAAP